MSEKIAVNSLKAWLLGIRPASLGGALMTVFLICMIPVAGCVGFIACALCRAAAEADRREEKLYEEWLQKHQKEDDA